MSSRGMEEVSLFAPRHKAHVQRPVTCLGDVNADVGEVSRVARILQPRKAVSWIRVDSKLMGLAGSNLPPKPWIE